MAVRAILWEDGGRGFAHCGLCPRSCRIPEGGSGACRVRVNRGGVLYSLASDAVIVANADPIEKKPLFHFLPGTETFSLGTPGCNMTCAFCQNHSLSQGAVPSFSAPEEVFPPRLARGIVASALGERCASVAFTYNEPLMAVEQIRAVSPLAREAGLAVVMVSNGYWSGEALRVLAPLVDAANFDLKSFSEAFYRDVCGAELAPVLKTLAGAVAAGWWVEVTTLLIPGRNDSDGELARLARFIRKELGPDVPWHISRFRPMHMMADVPVTPVSALERAHAIGVAEGLRFVYTGNVAGHAAENTFCPHCGEVFVKRAGYRVVSPPSRPFCATCGRSVPGIWGKA